MSRRRSAWRVAVAAALGSATLLAATACSSPAQTSAESKTINVGVLAAPGFNDCLNLVKGDFKKKTGITVNVQTIPYASMFDKFETGFAAGSSSYDLISIAFQWTGQFAKQGGIAPSSGNLSQSLAGVVPALNKQYQVDGKQYAVPYISSVLGYFYRTDIFKKENLTWPTTPDGLVAAVDKIAADPDLTSQGVSATSVMGDPTQGTANFNGLYRAYGGPALAAPDGSANPIDQAAAAKALTALKAMVNKSPAGALTATFATTPAQFLQGKVAIEPQFFGVMGTSLDASGSKVKGKYAFASAPGGGDLGGWGFAVTQSSQKKSQAQAFANYLASSQPDLLCTAKAGKSPVQTSNFTAPSVLTAIPYMPQAREALNSGVARYSGPEAGTQNSVTDTVTGQFLSGQIATAQEAAKQMADQIQQTRK